MLEAIVEERSNQYCDHLPMDSPGIHLARNLLAKAYEEFCRHREQLASILEALDAQPPCLATV
jgi:hypothetical protein